MRGRSPSARCRLIVHAQATPARPRQTDAKTIWEKIKGSWNQTKGAVKEQWGKLTDDDLLEIEGRRDQLVGKIQTRYGITKEEAEAQVSGLGAEALSRHVDRRRSDEDLGS